MKIAISADSFASFTSGYPVRGMMISLIKQRPSDLFVLFYTKCSTPTALEPFYSIINNLPNVRVVYFSKPRQVISILRILGLPIARLDDSYDAFIDPGKPEFWIGSEGKAICSIADLSSIRGHSTGRFSSFFRWRNSILYKRILPKMRYICAISDYTRRDILSLWPKLGEKIKVVYNGIDNFWFDSSRAMYKLPFDGDYFVWWGLISRRKNIESLINAYKAAKQSRTNLPNLLLIGGIEDYLSSIKDMFTDGVYNIPFQEDIVLKSIVKDSSGLIFPSLYEGFGLPIIEAFSQGKPVACSNCTSLPEVARGYAILFDPTDEKAISDAIIQLSMSPGYNNECIIYSQRYTYDNAARQYSALIDSL